MIDRRKAIEFLKVHRLSPFSCFSTIWALARPELLMRDLVNTTSFLMTGGFLCCHDYGRESLPAVSTTVNRFLRDQKVIMKGGEWVEIGVQGTLGVWKWVITYLRENRC